MPQKVARKTRTKKRQNNTPLYVGGGIVAVVVVGLLLLLNANLNAHPTVISPVTATGMTLGKTDAPVTIEEFADFQCPVCGRASGVIQQLAPKYFDTGKAKLVFHNFAFIGQESQWAAQAAMCANDQNKFWEFADYLFSHQAGENAGAFSQDNLKVFAKQLGLDTAPFNTCLDSGKYADAVRQDKALGDQRGIQATPTFFVNGQKVEGLLSVDQFGAMIDSLQK